MKLMSKGIFDKLLRNCCFNICLSSKRDLDKADWGFELKMHFFNTKALNSFEVLDKMLKMRKNVVIN